ncbi:MAG: DUF4258 domain-containing protein [Thermoguttaceae bacterium]|jgi:hypothetical protein
MNTPQKPITISAHAAERMRQRGADRAEVEHAIRNGDWKPAQRGKWHVRQQLAFGALSPINKQYYRFKALDVVFADESRAIVVVTVKVFYHNGGGAVR